MGESELSSPAYQDRTDSPPTQFEVGCAPGTSSTAWDDIDLELASGRGEWATRFAADLEEIWDGAGRLGLAVSGGPDSLALLLLAAETIPGHFEVATVDHGLRPESVAEAQAVASICSARGMPHRTLAVEVSPTGNLQANARTARYSALAAWAGERGLAAIVTAHHLDDQAETLLMRLARGAGVRGLAAMRPRSATPDGASPLLRPLLGWRREELARIVETAGLIPITDPSNHDVRFERAALRRQLPKLEWLDPVALAASASHLADADAALEWAAGLEDVTRTEDVRSWLYRPRAPRAVRLRVIERIIGGSPRGAELARLLETLEAGGTATLGTFKAEALADGGWRFTPVPRHRGKG